MLSNTATSLFPDVATDSPLVSIMTDSVRVCKYRHILFPHSSLVQFHLLSDDNTSRMPTVLGAEFVTRSGSSFSHDDFGGLTRASRFEYGAIATPMFHICDDPSNRPGSHS